jgi:uncharacterized protein YegP (UPF0339 family)
MSFEVYRVRGGRYRWTYRADNGRLLAQSDHSYGSKADAERGIATFQQDVAQGGTTDVKKPRESIFGISFEKVLVPVLVALVAFGGSYWGAKIATAGDLKVKAAELAFAGSPTLTELQARISVLAALYQAN